MPLLSDKQVDRLRTAIEWGTLQMAFPRKQRVEAIWSFCGSHYHKNGDPTIVPVNNLKMAVDIYGRMLTPRNPRVMMSTKVDPLKATAINLEYAVNEIPREIKLQSTLRKFVIEALFSMGILKVGIHTTGNHLGHPYGSPFVDIVTLDDYFVDMSAKSYDQIQYEGHDYWMNYEALMESEWVDKKARDKLHADEPTAIGINGEVRAEGIAEGGSAQVFKDRVNLRDVWLPEEKILVTMTARDGVVLNIIDWDGPDGGPFPKLGFGEVPGNLLPLAPVQIWRDLHDLGNRLFRKLGNQGDSEKSVLGFQGDDVDAIEAFKNASDGDGITYPGSKPETLTAGGIKEKTLAFYLQVRDLSSYFGGNYDSLGGLGAMSETVGQDQLMSQSANAQVEDMSDLTADATQEVMRALAYYEWHDPIRVRMLQKEIPNTDLTVTSRFGPEDKRGDFDLYSIKIDVYRMQENSPQIKLQKLLQLINTVIMPLHPFIQQAGGTIDVQLLLKHIAKYSDMPELNAIVQFLEPGQQVEVESAPASGKLPTGPPQPQQRGGMTREGQSSVIQQQLLGKGMQSSEAAKMA